MICKKENKKQHHVKSGHQEVFCKKALLKILQNSQNADMDYFEGSAENKRHSDWLRPANIYYEILKSDGYDNFLIKQKIFLKQ